MVCRETREGGQLINEPTDNCTRRKAGDESANQVAGRTSVATDEALSPVFQNMYTKNCKRHKSGKARLKGKKERKRASKATCSLSHWDERPCPTRPAFGQHSPQTWQKCFVAGKIVCCPSMRQKAPYKDYRRGIFDHACE